MSATSNQITDEVAVLATYPVRTYMAKFDGQVLSDADRNGPCNTGELTILLLTTSCMENS